MSREHVALAESQLTLLRQLYNAALEERICAYRLTGVTINYAMQSAQLCDIKKTNPEYKGIGSQVIQDSLERLSRAYDAFFER